MGTGAWGWERKDGSFGMGAWGWQSGAIFSCCLLPKKYFFDQMIHYLTLPRKCGRGVIIGLVVWFQTLFSAFVRALGWKHEDGHLGTGEDGSME